MNTRDDDVPDRERHLDEILGAYFEAVEAGQPVDASEWTERHPDFAPELADFFAVQERLHRLTSPLRGPAACGQGPEPDGPARPPTADPPANGDHAPSSRVRDFGDYELIDVIDRGGMGVVYRARQRSLDRLVAVKIIAPGHHLSDTALARFRNEARVVANLDHPGIVPIYEVGLHLGVSYFSMKLMEGGSLADRLPGFGSDPRSAARLVAQVARTVDHAHNRGVLHRDLKPSNLLLDAAGAVYVGDFGLARRIVEGPGADPTLTLTGELLGSPSYMAPEQAEGRREEVSIGTDVHGLGAVLYALLVGRPPFRADSVANTLDAVRRLEPEPPRRLNPAVPPDLEAICLKCLEKDPGRRYPTALGVADDLERFLADKPTHARPPGLPTRLRRRAGRYRRRLAIGAGGLLVCGLTLLVGLLLHHLERTRQVADSRAEDLSVRDRQGRHARYAEQIRLAAQLARSGATRECEDLLAGLSPAGPGDDDLRGFEWHYLRGLLRQEKQSWIAHGGREVYQVTFARDGQALATCGADGTARIWDAATLANRAVLQGHRGDVNAVDFAPDGRTLATVGDDATLRFWRPDGSPLGEPLPALGTPVPKLDEPWAVAVRFDRAGRRVFTGGADAIVRTWDVAARRETGADRVAFNVEALSLSPDGSLLVAALGGNAVPWFEVAGDGTLASTNAELHHSFESFAVAFSPDGRTLAVTDGREVSLWDVPSRKLRGSLVGHLAVVYALAFAPDGHTLASCDAAGVIRLWDIDRPEAVRILLGHRDRIWGSAFSPDGRTLATCSRDGTVKLWDARSRPDRLEIPGLTYISDVAFRDADTLVTATTIGEVRTFRLPDGELLGVEPPVVTDAPAYLCATRLAQRGAGAAATASPDGVRVRRLSGGSGIAVLPGEIECYPTPDGSLLVTRGADGRVWLRETASLRRRGSWGGSGSRSRAAGIAPDGAVLVVDEPGRDVVTLTRYDMSTRGRVVARIDGPPYLSPESGVFSPDGRWLAVPAERVTAVLFDGRTLERVAVLPWHGSKVNALAFSPDGRTLATGGGDGTVRLWNVASRQVVLSFEGLPPEVGHLAFGPDGRSLAAACSPPVVWRAVDGPPAPTPGAAAPMP